MNGIRPNERALKVMAYVDGELDAAERAEVERWIEEDAEAVLFANDLAELGSYVKAGKNSAVASFDIADAVMNEVLAEPVRAAPAADNAVVPIGAARASSSKRRPITGTVMWIAAGLAMAASVFLVTRGKEEAPMARSTTPIVQPAAPAPTNAGGAVDVENPGQSVSVFYLPDETSSLTTKMTTSVVVWVDESGAK